MKENIKFTILFPCVVLVMATLYVVLHEMGHAIVAIACGASITQFSVANAHMSYTGGHFTQITTSLLNASGMLFPVLTFALSLLFFKKDKNNLLHRCCYFAACLWGIGPLLAWVVVPIIALLSASPAGDDVTKFMMNSGWHPGVVALLSGLLLICLITFIFFKGIPQSFKAMLKSFQPEG